MQKSDKLQAILNFINGELSFEAKPKSYIVFISGEVYNIDGQTMNEDEFKAWHKLNVREIDSVISYRQDPDFKLNEKDHELSHEVVSPKQPLHEVIEAKEQPKKHQRKRRIKKIVEPMEPVMKTSGLMSRYGVDWEISDRSLYN